MTQTLLSHGRYWAWQCLFVYLNRITMVLFETGKNNDEPDV